MSVLYLITETMNCREGKEVMKVKMEYLEKNRFWEQVEMKIAKRIDYKVFEISPNRVVCF